LFKKFISDLPRPVRILDVGGEELYWERVGLVQDNDVTITLLNLNKAEVKYPNFRSEAGDARKMDEHKDKEFDIVFSNAVIEHVGTFNDQLLMANEVQRVGKSYFVQTPNRYFPIEPHFLFPFFQFLPMFAKVFLIRHFALGWTPRISDRKEAEELFRSIRLLTKKELMKLFPGAKIYNEKVFGVTKAFIVYKGYCSESD
jgi:2-polyprenyl-3-methyl-5-hydroxy-6-metoxy-1,4-benzoquinol methylase